MEKNLYNFLLTHGFGDNDIKLLIASHPELTNIPIDDALKNINIITNAGYPENDIGMLIAINPTFLLEDPDYLTQALTTLGTDIEEALKNNPFLI